MAARELTNLYLYLARRDKTGIRIIAVLQGPPQLPVRVADLSSLQMPSDWTPQITQIIYDDRMFWEPWIQSALSYQDLRAALQIRGYKNVPINGQPEFAPANIQSPIVNTSSLPRKTTMMRKN